MKIKSTKLLAMLLAVFMLFSFSSVALAATIEVDIDLIKELNATLNSDEKFALLEDVYAKLEEQELLTDLDEFNKFYEDAVAAAGEEGGLDAFFAKEEDMKNVFDETIKDVENSSAQTEITTTVVGAVIDSDIPDEKKAAIVETVTENVDMTEIIANVYDKAYAQAVDAGYVAKAVAGLETAIDGLDFVADYAEAYGLQNIDVELLTAEIALMQETIADVVAKIEAGDFETYEDMVATVSGMKSDMFEHYENIVALGRELSVILNPHMIKLTEAMTPYVDKVVAKVAPYAPEKVDAVVAKFNQVKTELPQYTEEYLDLLYEATHEELHVCKNIDYVALGGSLTKAYAYPEYFAARIENANAQFAVVKNNLADVSLTAANVAEYIQNNMAAIEGAEIITFNLDAQDMYDVMLEAIISDADVAWTDYADAETVALAKKVYEKAYALLAERYDNEKLAEIDKFAEDLAYIAVSYGIETFKALEDIAEANEDALIAVVGMRNPYVGKIITHKGKEIPVGDIFDKIIKATDICYETYAMLSGKVTFVSAADAADNNDVCDALSEAITFCTCSNDPYIPVAPGGSVEDHHFWCDGGENCYCIGYEDLDNTMWYHQGVCYMIKNGLMIGIGDSKWAPDQIITRAEIATILWRIEGSEVVDFALDFEDVEADMWYTEAIRWAVSEGIYLGYPDHKFGPNDQITREQLVTVLYRYELMDDETLTADFDLTTLSDADEISDWAVEAMTWAFDSGLIIGTDVDVLTASPLKTATRAEAAMIFYRKLDGLLK